MCKAWEEDGSLFQKGKEMTFRKGKGNRNNRLDEIGCRGLPGHVGARSSGLPLPHVSSARLVLRRPGQVFMFTSISQHRAT